MEEVKVHPKGGCLIKEMKQKGIYKIEIEILCNSLYILSFSPKNSSRATKSEQHTTTEKDSQDVRTDSERGVYFISWSKTSRKKRFREDEPFLYVYASNNTRSLSIRARVPQQQEAFIKFEVFSRATARKEVFSD